MKNIKNNFQDSIGNTPLIKLKAASEITGCNIYGKAEFMNPGGSVKDRAALALIKDAQEKKLISKGGIVVEGTAGNTGIGLGLLGNSIGYKTVIVMNDNQTQEKKDTICKNNFGMIFKLIFQHLKMISLIGPTMLKHTISHMPKRRNNWMTGYKVTKKKKKL